MRISTLYKLGRTQHELDFVDIDVAKDTPLFIDPQFMSTRSDPWTEGAVRSIRSFFRRFLTLIRSGAVDDARELFSHLGEPNETCLGISKGRPEGRGIGRGDADRMFESLRQSRAVTTGVVEDIEDCRTFVERIDKDKISDMTTNIIRGHLITYTQAQCGIWGIPMQDDVQSGFMWNRHSQSWENVLTRMLVIGDRRILLVPKLVVSYCDKYTPGKYHRHFVLNFLRNEHLRMNTALVQKVRRKDGSMRIFVTKKSIIEHEAPFSKDYLVRFTTSHPDVFRDFRDQLAREVKPISNEDIVYEYLPPVIDHLIAALRRIPPGPKTATEYHRTVVGILELLFYPRLTDPQIEKEIHDGRKRIDITFDNAATSGVFKRLHATMKIPCQYIKVECKNYSEDPQNPELDQLSGRFSVNSGKVGLLICRSIDDMPLFVRRCGDTYKDDRGVILPLTDEDLIAMLTQLRDNPGDTDEGLISDRIRDVTLQ